MEMITNLKNIDNKFSWSFLGFIIGILGFSYAIYVDQIKDEKPEVIFDVLSNTQVLSVKENLNKLDIIYDGQNLKEKKENLILLTIRISNDGNENIRETDYYSKSPFGFKINKGKIVDNPILIDASNNTLKNNIILTYDTLNNITINKVPFNKGQYFTIKILTICNENTLPTITPLGSITGINNPFPVKLSYKDGQKENKSFLELLTIGNFGIHIARFFFYLICIALFGLMIGIPTSKISSYLDDKKKIKKIKKFKEKTKIKLSDKIDIIFKIYKNNGQFYVKWLNNIINDKNKLLDYIDYYENRKKENILYNDFITEVPVDTHEINMERINIITTTNNILETLFENKILIKDNNEIEINEEFKTELNEFNYFIDIQ